jgi:integrase
VPDDLRPIIKKREIWVSYGTDSFVEAKRRHHREMAIVDALFADARKHLAAPGEAPGITRNEAVRLAQATADDIRYAAQAWFHAEERRMLQRWQRAGSDDGGTAEDREEGLHAFQEDQAAIHGGSGRDWAREEAVRALAARNLTLPPGELFMQAAEAFHTAAKEAVDRAVQRWMGLLPDPPRDARFTGVTAGSAAPELPPAAVTLDGLIVAYMAAPERAGLAPKTKAKYAGFRRVLCDLLGADTRAATITRDDCRRAQGVLRTLPANAAQRYPDLDAKQAAEAAQRDGVRPMHPKTVGNHLDFLASVFKWGLREGVIRMGDRNPAEGLNIATVRTVTASGEKRRPLAPAELKAIFARPLFTGCKDDDIGYDTPGPNRPRRGRFWVPLLGLFAGLRLNEACQLRTEDVREVDGVPVIFVRADAEGQRLKTRAAERRVPVHPELVRIGFLHLVSRQRAAGHDRLFPELPVGKLGNYSDPFSKWFGRFMEKAGVTARGVVFHSFRHSFRDRMTEAGIPDSVADLIGGWTSAGSKSEGSRYGEGGSVRFLAEHVARVTYPGLDLAHLYLPDDSKP